MRDVDIGKSIAEEMTLEAFVESYPRVTGDSIEILSKGEAPDFVARINGRDVGIELTEIRAETPEEYLEEVVRLSEKKEASYARRGIFGRSTILLCYGKCPPIYEMRPFLDGAPDWLDVTETKFSEIWLMDMSDEYFDARDPRKPADLYCLAPSARRGFYEIERTRKPYG